MEVELFVAFALLDSSLGSWPYSWRSVDNQDQEGQGGHLV